MTKEHLEIGFQLAAIVSGREDEYQTADQLQLLSKMNLAEEIRYREVGDSAAATCQLTSEGHLWLGVLSIKKQKVFALRCYVVQLDIPMLVGFYVETKTKTTFSDGPYFKGEGRDHHWLFHSIEYFERLNAQNKNRETAARATMSEVDNMIRQNMVSLERMKESYEAWHKDSSVGTLSGGLPSLGKRY